MLAFEKLAEEQKDEDTYDTNANNESEKLEGALEWEKSLQVKWKAERRAATEAREK